MEFSLQKEKQAQEFFESRNKELVNERENLLNKISEMEEILFKKDENIKELLIKVRELSDINENLYRKANEFENRIIEFELVLKE